MTNVEESRRRALALASRAPSAHNTQPWRVRASGNRLLVHADEGRWLRHTDPLRRDLGLALGGFCEALRIALHAEGAGVELRRTEGTFAELIVEGSAAPAPAEASLLRQRQTSRLLYAATPPPGPALAQLEAAARAGGLRLHLAAGTERASLDEWFFAAARESWLDDRAVGELRAWTRLDPTGRFSADDGLSARCLELGAAETLGMGALMAPPCAQRCTARSWPRWPPSRPRAPSCAWSPARRCWPSWWRRRTRIRSRAGPACSACGWRRPACIWPCSRCRCCSIAAAGRWPVTWASTPASWWPPCASATRPRPRSPAAAR